MAERGERRRALAVLSGHYRHRDLPRLFSPEQDGELLRRVLGNPELGGFACEVALNQDITTLRGKIYDFFLSATRDDYLFFHFSGHARKDAAGRLHLLAIDSDPQRLPPTALSADDLKEWVDDCPARKLVVVLDCCFAGAFKELKTWAGRSRIVLVSAGAAEYADEGEGSLEHAHPSPFTGAFFDGIETGQADNDGNGIITVREAYDHANRRILAEGARQTPQMRSGSAGDLALSRARARMAELPEDVQVLLRNAIPQARELAVDQLALLLRSSDRAASATAERFLISLRSDSDERVAERATRALGSLTSGHPDGGPDGDGVLPAAGTPGDLPGTPAWYPGAVFYEISVRSFSDGNGDGVGDLRGLRDKLPYLQALGVTCLILNPIFDSPLEDDGFDVSDFQEIHPDLGSRNDFLDLVAAAHRRGLRIVLDVVLNHTSRRHPWFLASRQDPSGPYGDFYVWRNTDSLYSDAIVDDSGPDRGGWTFDPVRKQYYWHRFHRVEPDLNFDSEAVQQAMATVLEQWLSLGADGFRLISAPYLYERDGSPSEGLEETHDYLRRLRRRVDAAYPGRVLIAWADKLPRELGQYFGSPSSGPECHVVLYASLIPRIFLAMRRESHRPLSTVLLDMHADPGGGVWGVYLRNAAELSLAMLGQAERDYLLQEFAPSPRMRSETGIRRRLAPLLDGDRELQELCTALLLSLPGAPFLYYGDEIGMGENLSLPGAAALRTPMQWNGDRGAGFSAAEPEQLDAPLVRDSMYGYHAVNVEAQLRNRSSLLWRVRRLLEIRRSSSALGVGDFHLVDSANPAILAFRREADGERALCMFNFSRYPQATSLGLQDLAGLVPVELSGGSRFPVVTTDRYPVTMAGHGHYWFRIDTPTRPPAPSPAEPSGPRTATTDPSAADPSAAGNA